MINRGFFVLRFGRRITYFFSEKKFFEKNSETGNRTLGTWMKTKRVTTTLPQNYFLFFFAFVFPKTTLLDKSSFGAGSVL